MVRRPLAILTNDDGCRSPGLLAAWRAVRDLADPLVVAPESPVGGAGKSITVYRPVKVSQFSCRGMDGYKVNGTPADCVLIGIHKIAARRPDLVVSGVNLGANLGLDDLTSSGTMGACLEASIQGIPSICASYCMRNYSKTPSLRELGTAGRIMEVLVAGILGESVLERTGILVLAIPQDPIRGVKVTSLARSPMPEMHEKIGEGLYRFRPRDLDLHSGECEDDDVAAVMEGAVSLTIINSLLCRSNSAGAEKLAGILREKL